MLSEDLTVHTTGITETAGLGIKLLSQVATPGPSAVPGVESCGKMARARPFTTEQAVGGQFQRER